MLVHHTRNSGTGLRARLPVSVAVKVSGHRRLIGVRPQRRIVSSAGNLTAMETVARSLIFAFAFACVGCSGTGGPSDSEADARSSQDVSSQDARAVEDVVAMTDVAAVRDVSANDAALVDAPSVVGPDCTGIHAPPAGLRRQTSFSLAGNVALWRASNSEWPMNAVLDLTTWNPAPRGQRTSSGVERPTLAPFGRNPGDTGTIEIEAGAYAAMLIDTAGVGDRRGTISSEQAGDRGAPFVLAISRCPGDFQPTAPNCRSDLSALAALGWTTGSSPATFCRLEPGQTYYLNVMFADPAAPSMSTCPFGRCWWLSTSSCSGAC